MSMKDMLKQEMNFTYTENGAKAYASTLNNVLDFFSLGAALRYRRDEEIIDLFKRAFKENELLALKTLFYIRDIRSGQGERRVFRLILKELAKMKPEVVTKNIHNIAEFGRWDDLYELFDTNCEEKVIEIMKKQIKEDEKTLKPSLLAKWLKSENTSSKKSVILAKKTRKALNMSSKEYRQMLSRLRKKIDILEHYVTEDRWNEINYEEVPSKANIKYRNAFWRNDEERYSKFLEDVSSGSVKVKTSTLTPFDIVQKAMGNIDKKERKTLDVLWNNLPDYGEPEKNSLAVIDVSGSMYPIAINAAISLGMYIAERCDGIFKNSFITFSEKPEFVEIKGRDLKEKVDMISKASWGYNTNIEKVFDLILKTALKNNLNEKDMPGELYIISDMEFDEADSGADKVLFKQIENKYKLNGYKMPNLTFWNVDSRNNQFPMNMDERGIKLVSGYSPNIFELVAKGEYYTPYEAMMEVLSNERYSNISI